MFTQNGTCGISLLVYLIILYEYKCKKLCFNESSLHSKSLLLCQFGEMYLPPLALWVGGVWKCRFGSSLNFTAVKRIWFLCISGILNVLKYLLDLCLKFDIFLQTIKFNFVWLLHFQYRYCFGTKYQENSKHRNVSFRFTEWLPDIEWLWSSPAIFLS